MEFEPFFQNDRYDTPEDKKRSLGSRLFFNNILYFQAKNFMIFKKAAAYANSETGSDEDIAKCSLMHLRHIENCGGKFQVRGLENLRKLNEPAIIIGNHMSIIETIVLPAIMFPYIKVTFVVKTSLFNTLWFGDVMKFMKAIPVDRVNPREDFKKIIEEGKKRVEEGYSVIVFPQAQRDPVFKPEEFNSIGVKLAKAAKAPIIPMALKTDFSQNGKWKKDLGWLDTSKKIHIEFGERMEITGNGKAERLKIIDFIEDRLKAWNH